AAIMLILSAGQHRPRDAGVCQFLYWQKEFSIPSSAPFGKIGDAYVAEVYRWANKNAIPVRRLAKGENREQIACQLIEAAGT
ncbi:hypothetical protein, partial [Mycobacterium hubeiense]|uniref:hypothetical protein n=1 Tax=Mycobacterium hubeiense TaxID=1867256 RepID=UPI001E38C6BB